MWSTRTCRPPRDTSALTICATGKLRWIFRTIPQPGGFGYDTWPKDAWKYIGGANSWSGLSLDEKRGLVFVPTGSAAFDFYGSNRQGDNLFANCLIALDASTGKRVWHFQFVKHDVWDRDLPGRAGSRHRSPGRSHDRRRCADYEKRPRVAVRASKRQTGSTPLNTAR